MKSFNSTDLKIIFDQTFFDTHNTILVFGKDEPFYRAAKNLDEPNIIYCRSNFYSSGLHEIAHWCIAGKNRRLLDDYGYWYSPDGRSLSKQKEFESVEIKPQAIEKIFNDSINRDFMVSADNLYLDNYSTEEFHKNVLIQAKSYIKLDNLPTRAKAFIQALKRFYH